MVVNRFLCIFKCFATCILQCATGSWCKKKSMIRYDNIINLMEDICMTVGEKLLKLRKEHDLTQEQFAELLKVSRQSVSKWELGTAYPDTEKLIRISKLFQCSLDYLLKDEVEQMDITIAAANEEARINKIRAGVLTYLSFPPIFGWIIGIVSLKFQKDCMKNKVQIVITIAGMLISLLLTGLMIAGVLFEL